MIVAVSEKVLWLSDALSSSMLLVKPILSPHLPEIEQWKLFSNIDGTQTGLFTSTQTTFVSIRDMLIHDLSVPERAEADTTMPWVREVYRIRLADPQVR
jgi:hypothetical protein